MYEDLNRVFTLCVRVRRNGPMIMIHAFDANVTGPHGHSRIDVEVRRNGQIVFPRGALYCGVPCGTCVDSIEAKELVLSLVGMKPGDTDDDYFAGYTEEQLAFARKYGEMIDCERLDRYCDENGSVHS